MTRQSVLAERGLSVQVTTNRFVPGRAIPALACRRFGAHEISNALDMLAARPADAIDRVDVADSAHEADQLVILGTVGSSVVDGEERYASASREAAKPPAVVVAVQREPRCTRIHSSRSRRRSDSVGRLGAPGDDALRCALGMP